jgi:hypothetical protein
MARCGFSQHRPYIDIGEKRRILYVVVFLSLYNLVFSLLLSSDGRDDSVSSRSHSFSVSLLLFM